MSSILGGRVLVVDDDASVRSGLAAYLGGRLSGEVLVLEASSRDEALDVMRAFACDVVVTDYNMPGGDGLQLLDAVAAQWPATVRIMVSAYGDRDLVLRAVNEAHVHGFVPKPVDPEALAQQVAGALLVASRMRLRDKMAHVQGTIVRDVLRLLGRSHQLGDATGGAPGLMR